MDKVHLIMPMGGGGTRFGNKGFNLPKPLIELQDKPFFYWAAQSVVKAIEVEDIIFVVLQEHINKFRLDERILEFYPEAKIHVISQILNGPVLTCCEGIKKINDNLPILFNDCDHAFICNGFKEFCKKADFEDIDGALLTFKSDNPAFSYVKFGETGSVTGTIEKQVVSHEAICGAYYFRNKYLFSKAAAIYLEKCTYTEFFVSGIYNELTQRKKKIVTFPIDEHITFGTPDEYDRAVNDSRLEVLK